MPSRVVNTPNVSNESHSSQEVYIEERPVPNVRRNIREVLVSSGGKTWNDPQDSSLCFRDLNKVASENRTDVTSHRGIQAEMISEYRLGTNVLSQRGIEEKGPYSGTNLLTRYQSLGQQSKPISTVRPQSAMALTSSSSSSSYQMKAIFPERPPSSLGAVWGSTHPMPGAVWGSTHPMPGLNHNLESRQKIPEHSITTRQQTSYQFNGHLHNNNNDDDSSLLFPIHHRSRSYGDGVTLGHGHSGEKSEDVYAMVARRPVQSKNIDTTPEYTPSLTTYGRSFSSGHVHSSYEGELNTGQIRGRENLAFVPEEQTKISGEIIPRQNVAANLPRPASTNIDLRSAWQRLYGNSPDSTYSSRRPSAGDIISTPKTPRLEDQVRHQYTKQLNGHHSSSRFGPSQLVKPDQEEVVYNVSDSATSLADVPGPDRVHTSAYYANISQLNQLTTVRQSPTGQSSSNPDQTSGSNNSSQLSSVAVPTTQLTTFKPHKKKLDNNLDPAIGPASKYPELPTGNRNVLQTSVSTNNQIRNDIMLDNKSTGNKQNWSSSTFISKPASPRRHRSSSTSDAVEFNIVENLAHPSSRFSSAFLDSDDSMEDEYHLKPHDSIFDYPEDGSDNNSASASLSHESLRATTRSSGHSTPVNPSPRFSHKNITSNTPPETLLKKPDLLRKSSATGVTHRSTINQTGGATVLQQTEKTLRSHLRIPIKESKRSRAGQDISLKKHSTNYARSRSLDDVRESGTESILSLDIENTILTVEPSDQSEIGTVHSYKSSNSVKAQLNRLEGMYTHVIKALGDTPHGTHVRRRWSIGSSDTSSLRHHSHQGRHSRISGHRLGSKDVKAIGKRFQRLESHVITLARSVAHLSSELRAQNTLSREIDNVKREIQELKSQDAAIPITSGNIVRQNRLLTEFEKCQGWVPSLTNPRRVNKLTKFFGQEPPLLEIFLKQLGYEKFLKNFEEEHISMIELPYMTEQRLQDIGIPMGPRLRIIQEAQLHFKQQGNVGVYFV